MPILLPDWLAMHDYMLLAVDCQMSVNLKQQLFQVKGPLVYKMCVVSGSVITMTGFSLSYMGTSSSSDLRPV